MTKARPAMRLVNCSRGDVSVELQRVHFSDPSLTCKVPKDASMAFPSGTKASMLQSMCRGPACVIKEENTLQTAESSVQPQRSRRLGPHSASISSSEPQAV